MVASVQDRLPKTTCDEAGGLMPRVPAADHHRWPSHRKKIAFPRGSGTMVSWWIQALESGAWRYDAEKQR